MNIRIGIICPSEIALRRFLPSLQRVKEFTFAGVAIASKEEWASSAMDAEKVEAVIANEHKKAQVFVDTYGGRIFESYESLIKSPEVDAVYLPLPPALHYRWAKLTLENGKHAYVEKPFTTSLDDTQELIEIARSKDLAVHENYMFVFHNQIEKINDIIASSEIGKVRQYRISFGFPRRAANDFRYNKVLGGGALLDAGGYCIRYASHLLGNTAQLISAHLQYDDDFEVDIFGAATMTNKDGLVAQLSFGMDNDYKCELEAWGSAGTLTTGRVLTAADGLEPDMTIKHNQEYTTTKLPADAAFEKSIRRFYDCVTDVACRADNYAIIARQTQLLNEFYTLNSNGK